jgi:hypothetical protein
MDLDNLVIKLCLEGTQAEFKGDIATACLSYQKAWESAQDDYEACIAAHYVARHQVDVYEKLKWNKIALDKANAVSYNRVKDFYPPFF